jgi:hypothetical protein
MNQRENGARKGSRERRNFSEPIVESISRYPVSEVIEVVKTIRIELCEEEEPTNVL